MSAVEPCAESPRAPTQVTELEALDLARHIASESTSRKQCSRVGCCITGAGDADAVGSVLSTACNSWDLSLAPNKGVCAELRALTQLVVDGLPQADAGERWTLVVTHSPCAHCATCIRFFPEITRVAYGREENDFGTNLLRKLGIEVERIPRDELPQDHEERYARKSPTRRLPPPSTISQTELIDDTGKELFRGVDPREVLIQASRAGIRVRGCRVRADSPLDFLQRLFCAACGVGVETCSSDEFTGAADANS